MSFIKGSHEALHTGKGYLSEQEYKEIGRKRAPTFTGDRSEVYKVFKAYTNYKTNNYLFDEADLIFNLFTRLKQVSGNSVFVLLLELYCIPELPSVCEYYISAHYFGFCKYSSLLGFTTIYLMKKLSHCKSLHTTDAGR